MKRLVILLAIMALCLVAVPVMADSGTWMSGNVGGGAQVWGAGDSYVSGSLYVYGESYSYTGGTYTYVDAGMYGEVYADGGAGYIGGGGSAYAGSYEGAGYAYSYADSGSSAYAATYGNASAYMSAGSWADSWAW